MGLMNYYFKVLSNG